MEPYHYRALFVVVYVRRPDIKPKAVFVRNPIVPREEPRDLIDGPGISWRLRAHITVLHAAADSLPRSRLLRRHETPCPGSIRSIRDTFERNNPVPEIAAHFPGFGFHHRLVVRSRDGIACRRSCPGIASVGRF